MQRSLDGFTVQLLASLKKVKNYVPDIYSHGEGLAIHDHVIIDITNHS